MKNFQKIVREKRKQSGLTQQEFGEKIGVSWITILRWEQGFTQPKDNIIDSWIEKVKAI